MKPTSVQAWDNSKKPSVQSADSKSCVGLRHGAFHKAPKPASLAAGHLANRSLPCITRHKLCRELSLFQIGCRCSTPAKFGFSSAWLVFGPDGPRGGLPKQAKQARQAFRLLCSGVADGQIAHTAFGMCGREPFYGRLSHLLLSSLLASNACN